MASFEQKILATIKRHRLWSAGEALNLAISGGVDSMVMLDVLCRTRRSHKARLSVVTFDHGLRDASSSEVEMVRSVCTEWDVSCEIESLQLSKGPNLQERARVARRTHLERREGLIATAHHASDQAETILFRLLRGSGLDGLQGMHRRQGRWLKPLLDVFKTEIYEYAHRQNLQWCEDPSNVNSTRGTIRNLWSELSNIHPNPEKALASVSTLLSRDADCLAILAEQAYREVLTQSQNGEVKLSELRRHPLAIQSRVLRMWCWEQGVEIGHRHIEGLLDWVPQQNGQRYQIAQGLFVVQQNQVWTLLGTSP